MADFARSMAKSFNGSNNGSRPQTELWGFVGCTLEWPWRGTRFLLG